MHCLVIIWSVLVAIPILVRMLNGHWLADLVKLRSANGAQKVLFIFGEDIFTSTTKDDFQQIADVYDGDVYYVKYPHDGYAIDCYCYQIINRVTNKCYSRLDVLGVSVGSQAYATFYEQLRRFPIEVHFWAVFPLNSCTIQDRPRKLMTFTMPILLILKVALGLLGQIPFIRRHGIWHSPSEVIEQLYLAVWDRPFWLYQPSIWNKPDDNRSYWGHCSNFAHGIIDGIVIAKGDKLINNNKVISTYKSTSIMFASASNHKLNDGCVVALRELGLFQ